MTEPTAIVTGGGRRIGAEICRELHSRGMNVIIHYHTSDDAAKVLETELNGLRPGSACLINADLSSTSECISLIEQARQRYQRLDVLVNNASVFFPTPLDKISESTWDEMVGINLRAPLFLSITAAPYLRETRGNIINLTDIHAERPLKNHTVYSVSKTGLVMLTKSLARELGPDIRVNAVSPGAILWPEHITEKEKLEILSKTVMGKQGQPADVARAVLYLVNDTEYTTGQVLVIDGGRTLFS